MGRRIGAAALAMSLLHAQKAGSSLDYWFRTAHEKPGKPSDEDRKRAHQEVEPPNNYGWPGILWNARKSIEAWWDTSDFALVALNHFRWELVETHDGPALNWWTTRLRGILQRMQIASNETRNGDGTAYLPYGFWLPKEFGDYCEELIEYIQQLDSITEPIDPPPEAVLVTLEEFAWLLDLEKSTIEKTEFKQSRPLPKERGTGRRPSKYTYLELAKWAEGHWPVAAADLPKSENIALAKLSQLSTSQR